MRRYNKIVLEMENVICQLSDGTNGELIVNFRPDTYGENYKNPVIPKGYKYVSGEWNNGFVIERESDGSQFVWVPVASLKPNGTIDGISFIERFGRREYNKDRFGQKMYEGSMFNSNAFHEELTHDFKLQEESIRKKYGGFYISRYNISKNVETGKLQSIKGVMPLVNISFNEAKLMASEMETGDEVRSHLIFGAEYDSVVEWLKETNAKSCWELACNSSYWGNYNQNLGPKEIKKTGSCKSWCANEIYDFAGNLMEMTAELYSDACGVARGGSYIHLGDEYPVTKRYFRDYYSRNRYSGFRVVLYIK